MFLSTSPVVTGIFLLASVMIASQGRAQSLGEIAKQQKPKDAKITTKSVFTDHVDGRNKTPLAETKMLNAKRVLWVAFVAVLLYVHLLVGVLVAIATAFYWLLEKQQKDLLAQREQEHQEKIEREKEQREFDAFFQEWGRPHRFDEIRLKVYAEKQGISCEERRGEAFDHHNFTIHNPIQEVRKDAKKLIERLSEAVSIAQEQGLTVELGSTNDCRSPHDGRIGWGEAHLPACKVTKDGQVRYYFPADFVEFVLAGCTAFQGECEGKYPYNQPGQAQLERLFTAGQAAHS